MKKLLALLLLLTAPASFAISEDHYAVDYAAKVVPFMAENAKPFTFTTFDGHALSAVHFVHPNPIGTIVIANGRSETWLKYAEVFYDLYQKGYSIYSYDHRGQGLSPHLSTRNPQIGHVFRFQNYVIDLATFVEKIVQPAVPEQKLFLLAHSMGGAVAASYLEQVKSPFTSVVLSSPMLQINTSPYSEKIALSIVALAKTFGFGNRYAIGYYDYDFDLPFEKNDVTGSKVRFEMSKEVFKTNPKTVLGGPSSRWVFESITATRRIQENSKFLEAKVLLLQAQKDRLVILNGQNLVCENAADCHRVQLAQSEHEILMERDFIRDHALNLITEFFK